VSDERPQSRESHSAKPSIFGDGLPERLRSTSFALLGITVAAGLVLVGLIFHQSWPVVPDLPIPGIPPEHEAAQERAVVAEAVDPEEVRVRARAVETGRSGALADPAGAVRPRSQLTAADRVAAQPAVPNPDPDPAPPVGEQPPGGAPAAPPPATPQPVEAPSPPSQPSPAPIDSPPVAASIDDADEEGQDDHGDEDGQGHDDDRSDEGEKGEGRDGGQGRPKGARKPKPPPPPLESGEDAPVQPPAVPQEEPDEDELNQDEPELDDQQDDGRGRGHWRRGR